MLAPPGVLTPPPQGNPGSATAWGPLHGRIQDFLEVGANPKEGMPNFPDNCMEIKKIGPRRSAGLKFYNVDAPLGFLLMQDQSYATTPVADPGFPRGEGANIRFCQIFPKTA